MSIVQEIWPNLLQSLNERRSSLFDGIQMFLFVVFLSFPVIVIVILLIFFFVRPIIYE